MDNYFVRINAYNNAMKQAENMLKLNLIDENILAKFEKRMAEKYKITNKSLYSLNNLLSTPLRGNITAD